MRDIQQGKPDDKGFQTKTWQDAVPLVYEVKVRANRVTETSWLGRTVPAESRGYVTECGEYPAEARVDEEGL
jgi:hypothetical protein